MNETANPLDFSHLMGLNAGGGGGQGETRGSFTNQAINRQVNYVQESPIDIEFSQYDKL